MKKKKEKTAIEEQQDYTKALYNRKLQLKQDYKKLSKKRQRIFICCYNIQSNEGFEQSFAHLQNKPKKDRFGKIKIPKFYILYLLYKYSKDNNDIMIFPFDDNAVGTEPRVTANNLVKKVIKKTQSSKLEGYIENQNGIFFFYNITYDEISNMSYPGESTNQFWYCLLDEICNHNKVLNFPVHKSVFNLFYQNCSLIYLKYKNKTLSIPVVAYQGIPRGKLGIQLMLRRPDRSGNLGDYSSLHAYNGAFRNAIWHKGHIASGGRELDKWGALKGRKDGDHINLEHRFSKLDDFGRYIEAGAIIRYAVFLGKKRWHIMYQDNDPFIKIIKAWDIKIDNLKQLEQYMEDKEMLINWWPENFDSLTTGMIRMKNISMHPWPLYTAYVFCSLNMILAF